MSTSTTYPQRVFDDNGLKIPVDLSSTSDAQQVTVTATVHIPWKTDDPNMTSGLEERVIPVEQFLMERLPQFLPRDAEDLSEKRNWFVTFGPRGVIHIAQFDNLPALAKRFGFVQTREVAVDEEAMEVTITSSFSALPHEQYIDAFNDVFSRGGRVILKTKGSGRYEGLPFLENLFLNYPYEIEASDDEIWEAHDQLFGHDLALAIVFNALTPEEVQQTLGIADFTERLEVGDLSTADIDTVMVYLDAHAMTPIAHAAKLEDQSDAHYMMFQGLIGFKQAFLGRGITEGEVDIPVFMDMATRCLNYIHGVEQALANEYARDFVEPSSDNEAFAHEPRELTSAHKISAWQAN